MNLPAGKPLVLIKSVIKSKNLGRGFWVGRVVFGRSWTYKTTAAACGNILS
jgi:hypothetical protein